MKICVVILFALTAHVTAVEKINSNDIPRWSGGAIWGWFADMAVVKNPWMRLKTVLNGFH